VCGRGGEEFMIYFDPHSISQLFCSFIFSLSLSRIIIYRIVQVKAYELLKISSWSRFLAQWQSAQSGSISTINSDVSRPVIVPHSGRRSSATANAASGQYRRATGGSPRSRASSVSKSHSFDRTGSGKERNAVSESSSSGRLDPGQVTEVESA
jgi:hypothetical protein